MSASINSLVPELRPYARALVDLAGKNGLQPRITSARRSHAEQTRLYRRYLAGLNPYPVAPPGSSAHEFGMAFDLVISPYDLALFKQLGQIWVSWGGVWGGAFQDPIHFELPGFPHKAAEAGPLTAIGKTIVSLATPTALQTKQATSADQFRAANPWLYSQIEGTVQYLARILG